GVGLGVSDNAHARQVSHLPQRVQILLPQHLLGEAGHLLGAALDLPHDAEGLEGARELIFQKPGELLVARSMLLPEFLDDLCQSCSVDACAHGWAPGGNPRRNWLASMRCSGSRLVEPRPPSGWSPSW